MTALAKGDSVGRYFVLEELGRGGAGVVYAAQDPELDRRVALKLLPIADPASVEPLTREARVLAKLSHANVATVFDVGVTDAFVYIAMEYVDGGNLLQWVESASRTPEAIVDVFTEAGKGLLAAHRRGLVHRDFKPSNVLLDGDGRVLVADFGLAQIDPQDSDADRPGHALRGLELELTGRAGTPGFVAPEVLAGDEPDARSDQFAFCVSLLWALSGKMPDEVEDPTSVIPEIPTRPHARSAILRGLAAKPGDRFESMDSLLDELGRPRPPVRRAWIALGLVAALGGGAVIGARMFGAEPQPGPTCAEEADSVGLVWNPTRAEQVRSSLAANGRGYAEATAQRVVTALDAFATAWQQEQRQLCEADDPAPATRSRQRCLDERLIELDALATALGTAEGAAAEGAMDAVARLTPVESCRDPVVLANRVAEPAPELEASVGQTRRALAVAKALEETGQHEKARQAVDDLLQQVETVDYRPLQGQIRMLAGRIAMQQARFQDAELLLAQAFADALASNDDDTLVNIGALLVYTIGYSEGQPERADQWITLSEATASHGGVGVIPRTALWVSAGVVAMHRGDNKEARRLLEQALSLGRDELGEDHPETTYALSSLAALDMDENDFAEAERRSRRVLEIRTELLGEEHPDLIVVHNTLGGALSGQGKLAEAEQHLRRALEIGKRSLGGDHPRMVAVYNNAGSLLSKMGDNDAAVDFYREALDLLLRTTQLDDPRVALARNNLAAGLYHAGRFDEAAAEHQLALEAFETRFGAEHPKVAMALNGLVTDLATQGRCDEAAPLIERAGRILESDPTQRRVLAFVRSNEARVQLCRGNLGLAVVAAEHSLELLDAVPAPSSRASIEGIAARVLLAAGRLDEAYDHASRSLKDAGSPLTKGWARWVRASVHQKRGETDAMVTERAALVELRRDADPDDTRWPPAEG